MENRVLILDQKRIDKKLQRMAFQLWEYNSQQKEVTFIGIEGAGMALARNLAERLQQISELKIDVIPLTINKRKPLSEPILLDAELNGRSVVLVDDVANSGKTLMFALKPLLSYEPSSILIAVLVDRKHKSYPVAPDIVGHSIATTLQEHIEVICEGNEITGAYLQ